MRSVLILWCVAGVTLGANPLPAAEPKPEPRAGWAGVFPDLGGYQRTFTQPAVNKDKTVYRQSVKYEWTGNDIRVATATLARDPEFKTAHAAEALKKAGAKEIKLGKKDAWIMPAPKDGDRIIVPLGEDKALIVEGSGAAHKAFPTELAGAFDTEKCTAALARPPRTEFGRTLDAFKALRKGMSLAEVREWVGDADGDVGSGIHIMAYKLPDQSRVLIGFPSFDKLTYVKHEKDGKTEDLVK
jgi:hypothetical protein